MGRMGGPPGANMQTGTQVNPESDVKADTTAGFSMKALIRGYMGRDTLKPGYMLLGTAIVPGAGQIYNKQWWKVPIIYGGLGAGIYTGISNNIKYRQTGDEKYKLYRNLGYIGAGLTYWGRFWMPQSHIKPRYQYLLQQNLPYTGSSSRPGTGLQWRLLENTHLVDWICGLRLFFPSERHTVQTFQVYLQDG